MERQWVLFVFVLLLSSLVINFSGKSSWKKEALKQNRTAISLEKSADQEIASTDKELKKKIAQLTEEKDGLTEEKNRAEDRALTLQFYLERLREENSSLGDRISFLEEEIIRLRGR